MTTETNNLKLVHEAKGIIQEAVECPDEVSITKTAIEISEKVGNYCYTQFERYVTQEISFNEDMKTVTLGQPHQDRINTLRFALKALKRITEGL